MFGNPLNNKKFQLLTNDYFKPAGKCYKKYMESPMKKVFTNKKLAKEYLEKLGIHILKHDVRRFNLMFKWALRFFDVNHDGVVIKNEFK